MSSALKACLITAYLILWAFLSAVDSGPRVSIKSPGAIAAEPADWWILVTVEPREENRVLVIEADGEPGEYRRSDYQLEGEKAARLRQIWFKGIRAGCYVFSASVHGNGRQLGIARSTPLHVIGREGDPCGAG